MKPDPRLNLERANRARSARADLKRAIRVGSVSVADLIDPDVTTEHDELAGGMRVDQLVTSLPWFGLYRYRRMVEFLGGIPERTTLGDLPEASARHLAAAIRRKLEASLG